MNQALIVFSRTDHLKGVPLFPASHSPFRQQLPILATVRTSQQVALWQTISFPEGIHGCILWAHLIFDPC